MTWLLYMMVCDAGGGFSYCKIGISRDLAKRVAGVQTGCPIPISDVAYLQVGSTYTRQAEAMMHSGLKKFHSQGEWFRLNFTDPEHKAAFQEVTKRVIDRFGATHTCWKHMDLDAVRLVCRVLRLDEAA
jgi:hypothetical protein